MVSFRWLIILLLTFIKNKEEFLMKFSMDSHMQFPLVELSLNQGETVFIQRGSMVYHTPNVSLNTQLNASGYRRFLLDWVTTLPKEIAYDCP